MKTHFFFPENPCLALHLCRHYRLLADTSNDEKARERYKQNAAACLASYIGHPSHSAKLQNQLTDFVLLNEMTP